MVEVRHLWPGGDGADKSGEAPADYRSEIVKESYIGTVEGGEGRVADGIVKITGDQTQDNNVNSALDNAESNGTYNGETNNCSNYTKKGVEATGISGGNGANVKVTVTIMGSTVKNYNKNNIVTPVSVHNAVVNSKDSRVSVVKPLPSDENDPNIDKKIDY